MSIKRFQGSWDLSGPDADKLAQELYQLGDCHPWSTILRVLTHGPESWLHNLVRCTLSYDKNEDMFSLALNNLVA